ncbi:unnamed protein product [Haemonchus placei]|uniref:Cu2_monooxygen domain-containing protein n=1 Tax=Haemonchus placei TaxID=6290 RepID=A0A0N4VSH5_HAEPC|nr:unnamed protein product [Haemonchus placei]
MNLFFFCSTVCFTKKLYQKALISEVCSVMTVCPRVGVSPGFTIMAIMIKFTWFEFQTSLFFTLFKLVQIFLCESDNQIERSEDCNDMMMDEEARSCSHVLAAWATGEGPINYPSEAGLPLGGQTGKKYLKVEIHYNNLRLQTGIFDESGFVFFVTPKLSIHSWSLKRGCDVTINSNLFLRIHLCKYDIKSINYLWQIFALPYMTCAKVFQSS